MEGRPSSNPDSAAFAERTDPYRRELIAHCYRMLGSLDDAEDLVQETYVRAWRAYSSFEGRSSVRTWLYRIATNVCLTALQQKNHRWLPSGLTAPSAYPVEQTEAPPATTDWLQPIPDSLIAAESDDPAVVAELRASLRLALIAALQYLLPRQRATLILCEVLDWAAAEAADVLGTTTAAVKSTLQRARARLREVAPAMEDVLEPAAPDLQLLLETYMAAFENSDVQLLAKVLQSDATIEVVPSPTWFAGVATCLRYLESEALFSPGDWRMLPTVANGQAAAAAYLRAPGDSTHRPWGIGVLTCAAGGIARITVFDDPHLVGRFGLPTVLSA
ncbi:MAG: sigma-70 family RNA polymerase sigma factor [Chloroflexi bacterium]|nr:sigma-70 family RNA polymerase sigma factor [Chloroflexota bacterium]MBV9897476.1 sigma-70 family RNA polymerase sigma factor [Chloroflexota bacterium]